MICILGTNPQVTIGHTAGIPFRKHGQVKGDFYYSWQNAILKQSKILFNEKGRFGLGFPTRFSLTRISGAVVPSENMNG